MPTINSSSYTTLYSATAQEIVPATPYGNSNVEAFLNQGTDGGNTILNIVANGNITANGFFIGDGGYLSNLNAGNFSSANYANYAGNVTISAQPNITSVGVLNGLVVNGNITPNANIIFDIGNNTNRFNDIWLANSTIHLGVQNINANATTTFFSNSVSIANNMSSNNVTIAQTFDIDSPGYYFPSYLELNVVANYNPKIFGLFPLGNTTIGSNVITVTSLYNTSATTIYPLADFASNLPGLVVSHFNSALASYVDDVFPLNTTITSVDVANNQIICSNVALLTTTNEIFSTSGQLSNAAQSSYFLPSQAIYQQVTGTDGGTNEIQLDNTNSFYYFNQTNCPVIFQGTTFGGLQPDTTYYIVNVDLGTNRIQVSQTPSGPVFNLSTATGTMYLSSWKNAGGIVNAWTVSLNGQYNFGGPWVNNPPTLSDFTQTPNFNATGNITIPTQFGYVKPVNFNSNQLPYADTSGQFVKFEGGILSSDDNTYGTPGIFGRLKDTFISLGATALHTGLNSAAVRTNFQIINYTDFAQDNASVTNPVNPPALSFTTSTGNVNSPTADAYLRTGRSLGRIAFYAYQRRGINAYIQPGSTPAAGIYVQALGDWNDNTNTSLPMVFALQYSPLNAATGDSGTSYSRINRTFLQAANNTTSIGGASTIEFKPLARSNNGTNNRSYSGLGNVSINPQTWATISGYTVGNAFSNGAGALMNVTTTDNNQNGNVALRLSRTVANTANMEFRLPTANANTMVLVDNASGNTIATFTNGDVKVANATINTGGFMKLATYTAAALNAIGGQAGWMACVTDSAGGGNPNGMIAFWDTTNARWSYVHDNSAV